jgi:hypothetical protein
MTVMLEAPRKLSPAAPDLLRNWNRKRLLFFTLCATECADDPEMLHKALAIIHEPLTSC